MLLKSQMSISVILSEMHFFSLSLSRALSPSLGLDFFSGALIKPEFKCLVCWDGLKSWKRDYCSDVSFSKLFLFQKQQTNLSPGESLCLRGSEREAGQQWV